MYVLALIVFPQTACIRQHDARIRPPLVRITIDSGRAMYILVYSIYGKVLSVNQSYLKVFLFRSFREFSHSKFLF